MNKTTAHKKSTNTSVYENNPFYIPTKGIDLLFKYAPSIGIVIGVYLTLTFLLNFSGVFNPAPPAAEPPLDNSSQMSIFEQTPTETFLLAGIAIVMVVMWIIAVAIYISAVINYTTAKIARHQNVTIGTAMSEAFKHFWGFAWLQVLIVFKIFLWSLLLIIPGIIMAVRYSLAGVSYFDKGLRGNAAIKDSLALTKGAWLTTAASQYIMYFVTLGMAGELFVPGARALLYTQLNAVTSAGKVKPNAHVLSWIVLLLPFIVSLAVLALVSFAGANYEALGPSI